MKWRGDARAAARLLCVAAVAAACTAPALGQQLPPADVDTLDPTALDPSAPLDPMPDLGVEWPDLDSPDAEIETPGGEPLEAEPAQAISDSSVERAYRVAIEGLAPIGDSTDLMAEFDERSALYQDDDPANSAQIDRRSRADAELLAELLRSQGFYDAAVEPRIESRGDTVLVILEAVPGEQYRFASVELPGLAQAGAEAASLRETFAVEAGDPVIAEEVIAAGIALKVALGEQGFALAEVGEQDILIDHETRTARLVLPVDPGPEARFGQIRVSGNPPFSARHVALIARFDPDEPFRRSRVDDLRRALIATGLVSSAEVRVVPAPNGKVDLEVQLQPAPMRTVAGELGYGTGEGLRAEASWEHRNLFNPEGALRLRGVAGTKEQLVGVQFRRNNFLQRDQVLNLQAFASNVDRDAYEARTILIGGGIERQSNIIWHKKWTWSLGADLLATDERGVFDVLGAKESQTFLLVAFPATLGYDGSDDLLNPTRGFRLLGRVSPEISAHGGSFAYGKVQLDGSVYRPFTDSVVGAARVRLASIVGAPALSIAPSRRIYAGGGGSVRGYGYQQLGPRDLEGDPIGGRSLIEFALEARVRLGLFGGNFGIVPFLDGGNLVNDAYPNLDDWQFGAGLGIRYYSSFGPIRVDVGTPLNPREGDGPIAVTVSLGQAF